MPTHDNVLLLRDVRVAFGAREVLHGLDLTLTPGRILALLGMNGAGKTTTIRSICGLVEFSGEIRLDGSTPGSAAASALLGVMPQETGAWSGIRVEELLRYLAGLYAHPHDVDALMAELEMTGLRRTTYRRLSGGERQLVNLAGALVGRCPIVILDEPTAGLDPHARRRVWNIIQRLGADGVAVLLTTHAMDEVDALADDVVLLHEGRITYRADARQLEADGGADAVFHAHTKGHHE